MKVMKKTQEVSRQLVLFLIALVCLAAAAGCVVVWFGVIHSKTCTLEVPFAEGDEGEYSIEEVTEKDRYYQIDGWAGRNGQDVTLFDTSILLKREEDTEYYLLSTEMRQKPELGGEVGHNFSNGGFCAAIRKKDLKEKGNYQVYIWYKNDGNNVIIPTDTYVKVK